MTADAELIALCDRLVALRREECLICIEDPSAPDEGPQHARSEAVLDEQSQVEKRIYDTPEPVSSDGCQAVARAALVNVARDHKGDVICNSFDKWLLVTLAMFHAGPEFEAEQVRLVLAEHVV